MEREKQREKERQSRQQQVSENNVKDKKELFGSPVKVIPRFVIYVQYVLIFVSIVYCEFISFVFWAWCRLAGLLDIAKNQKISFFLSRENSEAVLFYFVLAVIY